MRICSKPRNISCFTSDGVICKFFIALSFWWEMAEGHSNHNGERAAQQQKQLRETQSEGQQRIQEEEEELQNVSQDFDQLSVEVGTGASSASEPSGTGQEPTAAEERHAPERSDLLQYYHRLTLDHVTAHRKLRLSEDNRSVKRVERAVQCPVNDRRFDNWVQVLCEEGCDKERWYWEAEWSGSWVDIAVSYKEIKRRGRDKGTAFGDSEMSWALRCSSIHYTFRHNNKSTIVLKEDGNPVPPSSRIGVDLDHRAGTLSFYSVSDTMTLLHSVQTTFTQPLYPGFRVADGSSIHL